MTTERIITLRARRTELGLEVGMLLGSPKGRVIYRVIEVTRLHRAGEVQAPRLRLVCRRLGPGELPDGVEVYPWPSDRQAPRRPRQTAAAPVRRSPLEMALLIAASRRADRRKPRREPHYGVDVGPTLRLEAVIDIDGKLIREADVSIKTVRDPTHPQRILRRAKRADPLEALERAGSISAREVDAAETLRTCLETMTPPLGQTSGMAVHTPAFLRKPISAASLDACEITREAAAKLGRLHWEAVLWVCLGGTVTGFKSFRGIRTQLAGELVRVGMVKLADHFEGENICAQ